MRLIVACVLVAAAALACTGPAAAFAKQGKIHACYATKGPDKGAMRFVRGKKCHHGEKSLKWNKTGKPGPSGQPGPTGPAGGASQDALDQLHAQLDQQAARIDTLETQIGQLTAQYDALAAQVTALAGQITGLGGQFDSFKSLACGQLADLTSQSNAMGTALDAIGLGGTIPPLLTLTNPGAPTGLPAFSC